MLERLSSPREKAIAYLEEIEGTLTIYESYRELIVARQAQLYAAFSGDDAGRRALPDALKSGRLDVSALYRGALVQIISTFESFIRDLAGVVVYIHALHAGRFDALPDSLADDYIVASARILSHMKEGTVRGQAYDFISLLGNLTRCVGGVQPFSLQPDVFTTTLGNPTPDRIESLFRVLGLQEPFSKALGNFSELKSAVREERQSTVARLARDRLGAEISRRNQIVHGDLRLAITEGDILENIVFFRALMGGLEGIARSSLSDH